MHEYISKDKFAFRPRGPRRLRGLRVGPVPVGPVPEPVPGPVPGSVSVPGLVCFGLSIFALGLETEGNLDRSLKSEDISK